MAASVQADEVEDVSNGAEGSASTQCMLAKKRQRSVAAEQLEERVTYKYQPKIARRALEYFHQWSKHSLVLPDEIMGVVTPALTQEDGQLLQELTSMLVKNYGCSEEMIAVQDWKLMERKSSNGVDHLVFKITQGGRLQYIAKKGNHILAADPPVNCNAELLQQPSEVTYSDGGFYYTGKEELLQPENDPLVNDCKELFTRTAEDICKKTMDVEVKSASLKVVDGFEVKMMVDVTGPAGKKTLHSPACFFEVDPNAKDASLLQYLVDPAETNPLPEEKDGMTATLRMSSDLCKADEEDGKNIGTPDASLLEERGLGDNSFYKGYEHVNDNLPRALIEVRSDLPDNFDMRKQYPKCFQQGGKEVMRNQGNCGSCWAFAGSSAIMNNLCTSTNQNSLAFASPSDRYEVSVQQIMSCNAAQQGCKGGNAHGVDEVVKKRGLSKEREKPYICKSGKYTHHFHKTHGTCSKAPWGAPCDETDRVREWNFGGAYHIKGESQIMTMLSRGDSAYFGMRITHYFHTGKFSGVYKGQESRVLSGGHAMTMMGYGVQDGEKYWLIQNSWGDWWQDNGYGKILRGVNLLDVEDHVYYMKAWLDGATQKRFQCQDTEDEVPGLTSQRCDWSGCHPVKTYCKGSANLCDYQNPGVSAAMKEHCPVTCNTCPKKKPTQKPRPTPSGGPERTPSPTPLPTPLPTPPPTSPPTSPTSSDQTILEIGSNPNGGQKCSAPKPGQWSCDMPTTLPPGSWSMSTRMSWSDGDFATQVCMSNGGTWTQNMKLKCSEVSWY